MIVSVRLASKSTPIELLQYPQPAHLSWIRITQERNANRKIDFSDSIGQNASFRARSHLDRFTPMNGYVRP